MLVQAAHAATWYVSANGNDNAAGTNWATAKQTIQAAIDMAVSSDTVLVSNGVYDTGGRVVYGAMTNRVAVTKPVKVQSVNGPAGTIIRGAWNLGTTNGNSAIRCAYVSDGASLTGFALTNGATRSTGDYYRECGGGGAWCDPGGILSNCTLTGNSAASGGGACNGTLNNCTLTANWATSSGGGVSYGTLNNCTLTANSSSYGGGVYYAVLNNCTLMGNSASSYGGGAYNSTLLTSA